MKKVLTVLVLSVLLISLSSNNSQAQFRLKLGPQVGLNYNLHTGSDMEETGTGFGLVIGGTVDMSFTPTIGLITNMQFYDNRSGSTTNETSRHYTGENNEPVTSTYTIENSVSLAYFLIEPLFKLNMPNSNLYFVMGPSFGFNVEGSGERIVTEKFPPAYANNDTKATDKVKYTDLLARFELKMGAGMDIPLSTGLYLAPQLSFGYGITKVESDVAWRVLTIQGLVAVKFSLL
ncbi:MAG: outer membrane beta-barrel protein [Syntrophothermus sp.]